MDAGLAAAGVEHRRIYDLRHTYATWSLAAGVDIFTLARRMGTSVKMIDRTYGHLVAGADVYERELLDAFDGARGGLDTWWTRRPGRCGVDGSPVNEKSPAIAGLLRGSGSDGTRTRDLRRDRRIGGLRAHRRVTRGRRCVGAIAPLRTLSSAEQVLVTAAVADDIPGDWDARRIEITMQDDDSGRVSMVQQ